MNKRTEKNRTERNRTGKLKSTIDGIRKKDIWSFKYLGDIPQIDSCVLIEGLPGIGNVGKIAVDFIIDELEAKKVLEITSSSFPHSVFVNEDNLVELPKIELFYKKIGKKHFFFISGDVQPPDETSCYDFSDMVLYLMEELKCKEIVTLGGIGLGALEGSPRLFCTGNNHDIIKRFKISKNISEKLYGVVGPIMGVSGLIVGLAERHDIDAICILAETLNHPLYLGISGAREIVKLLEKRYSFGVKTRKLDKEIKELEASVMVSNTLLTKKQKDECGIDKISYIG